MNRQTSLDAYRKNEASGLFSRRRWEVYTWLFQHGPATAGRIDRGIFGQRSNRNNTANRLKELRVMGVTQEVGEAKEITGETVILWDVTDALARPYKRRCDTPTAAELKNFVKDIRKLYEDHPWWFTKKPDKVLSWLTQKARTR